MIELQTDKTEMIVNNDLTMWHSFILQISQMITVHQ